LFSYRWHRGERAGASMRGAWWRAALVVAAAQWVCVDRALADMLDDVPKEPTFLFFSGVDLWREGAFLHGGVLWSPRGLAEEGLTLKLVFGSGSYQYRSGALGDVTVTGRQQSASLMPGWRFKRDGFEITAFAGADAQQHRLSPDDPSSSLRGDMFGLRTGFDLWYEPTRATMLAADASYSTIGDSYSAHVAFGWRFLDRLYIGPEALTFACDDYRQYRFGLQVTGFKTETLELSAGVGHVQDSDDREGAYGRLSIMVRR
jgi:hypothetical protein